MNDPHVVTLFYKIMREASADYREAEPRDYEEKDFSLRIADGKVCFTMKVHYATEEEAKEAVGEYIDRWEFDVGLQGEPSVFTLVYQNAEIEERNPALGMAERKITVGAPLSSVRTVHSKPYPPPPSPGLTLTDNVRRMFDRFRRYHLGREPLPSMAYFCLDILERSTQRPKRQRRPAAAQHYGIDLAVLGKIGFLSSDRGGPQARKASGTDRPLTSSETRFLEKATAALIRRAAEIAYDPGKSGNEIKLSDLWP